MILTPYFLTSLVGYFSFLTFGRFSFPIPSPRLCPHTASTSKILADNGYENSATNYNELFAAVKSKV